jgi:hypothetical protein
MRREVAVLALAGLGLSLGSCAKEKPVPPPQCPEGQVCMVPPSSLGDEIAGCDADRSRGAALVKVKVKLKVDNQTDKCVASVKPERVCVMQGGTVRWKVDNGCGPREDPNGALLITKLDWLACDPKFTVLKEGPHKRNVLFCGVPDDQEKKEYKYDVEGPDIEGVDPWIEVRRGG